MIYTGQLESFTDLTQRIVGHKTRHGNGGFCICVESVSVGRTVCVNEAILDYRDKSAQLQLANKVWHALLGELHFTHFHGVEGEVFAGLNVLRRVDFGATLANNNLANLNDLAVGTLDAQALGLGISAVSC